MKSLSSVAMCFIAASLLTNQAKAQCPANPLDLIKGTTWAFLTQDGLAGDATIGIFTATDGPTPKSGGLVVGTLDIAETFNNAGQIGQGITGQGKYGINPDCSGGILYLNVFGNAYQYSFVFTQGGTRMYLLSSNTMVLNNGVGASAAGNRGTAVKLSAAPSCSSAPNPSNPLSLLVGSWSFLSQDYESAESGQFTASIDGKLAIFNETSSGAGEGSQGVTGTGRFGINSDCSGGLMYFNTFDPYQYTFIFVNPNEIFLLASSTDISSHSGGVFRGHYGIATRQ
jgi:hypothetical protein